jgi:hypothetical protein
MTLLIQIVCAVVAALAIAVLIADAIIDKKLKKKATALDMREIRIKEREDILEADRKTLQNVREQYLQELARLKRLDPPTEITAGYVVTESDEMKYNTEKAIYANAKNRLAMTIAHDIVKKFEPEESTTESGRRKFTYKLYISE